MKYMYSMLIALGFCEITICSDASVSDMDDRQVEMGRNARSGGFGCSDESFTANAGVARVNRARRRVVASRERSEAAAVAFDDISDISAEDEALDASVMVAATGASTADVNLEYLDTRLYLGGVSPESAAGPARAAASQSSSDDEEEDQKLVQPRALPHQKDVRRLSPAVDVNLEYLDTRLYLGRASSESAAGAARAAAPQGSSGAPEQEHEALTHQVALLHRELISRLPLAAAACAAAATHEYPMQQQRNAPEPDYSGFTLVSSDQAPVQDCIPSESYMHACVRNFTRFFSGDLALFLQLEEAELLDQHMSSWSDTDKACFLTKVLQRSAQLGSVDAIMKARLVIERHALGRNIGEVYTTVAHDILTARAQQLILVLTAPGTTPHVRVELPKSEIDRLSPRSRNVYPVIQAVAKQFGEESPAAALSFLALLRNRELERKEVAREEAAEADSATTPEE